MEIMSKLPMNDSDEEDEQRDPNENSLDGDDDHQLYETVGVAIPPSTLAHEVRKDVPPSKRRFNTEFHMVADPDPQLGSSMLSVLDTVPKIKPEMQAGLLELTEYCSSIAQLMSVAGTAMALRKIADMRYLLPDMIDILVQSDQLHVGAQSNEPTPAKRLMLAAMSYPMMDSGSILLDHRIAEVGYGNVTNELADLLVAATYLDITNLQHRYYTASLETIPVGGMNQAQVSQVVQRKTRQTEMWFSPDVWAPWGEETDVPSAGPRKVVALLPIGFDRISGGDIQLRPVPAPVEDAHLLTVQPLSADWVEETLMEESIAFLEREILEGGSTPIKNIWEEQCRDYGFDDAEARFRDFRDNHLID